PPERTGFSGTGSIDYQLMSNVSLERNFNSGCAIRSILQCSSSHLPETCGRCESVITIELFAQKRGDGVVWFGSGRTRSTTTLSGSFAKLRTPRTNSGASISILTTRRYRAWRTRGHRDCE